MVPGLGLLPPCPLSLLRRGTLVLAGHSVVCAWMCLKGKPRPQGELCAASRRAGWDGEMGSASRMAACAPFLTHLHLSSCSLCLRQHQQDWAWRSWLPPPSTP